MRLALVVAMALAMAMVAAASSSSSEEDLMLQPDPDVMSLTMDNFDAQLLHASEDSPLFVEFYAPWCGHCKALRPHWSEAGRLVKAEEARTGQKLAVFAKVNADDEQNKPLASRFSITAFPTIKIFRRGDSRQQPPATWNGPRDSGENILAYAKRQRGPSVRVVNSVGEMDQLVKERNGEIFAYFLRAKGLMYSVWRSYAEKKRDSALFVESFSPEVLNSYGIEANTLRVYRSPRYLSLATVAFPQDVPFVDAVRKSWKEDELEKWLMETSLPLVGEYASPSAKGKTSVASAAASSWISEAYTKVGKPVFTVFGNIDFEKDPKGSNYLANRVRKAAKKLADEHAGAPPLNFAVGKFSDFEQELADSRGMFPVFATPSSGNVAMGVIDHAGKKNYPCDGAVVSDGGKNLKVSFGPDAISACCKAFLEGKIENWVKSETIPNDNDQKDVATVVALNFESVVLDPTKHVLLEVMAPWCGHCKKFAPDYERVHQ